MSDDEAFGFAAPPFKAADALLSLRRQLRDWKLSERGTSFAWAGRDVITLSADDSSITAKLAKKLSLTPELTTQVLRSSSDVRKFQDTVKQQLARWADSD
jgi:hypothetical protein